MRDLPRQLTVDELAELFEGRTRLVEELAATEDPLGEADRILSRLGEDDKVGALSAHPAIGQRHGLSERSASEQGTESDPAVLSELAYLNQVYEEKFGFRFVVFVAGRPKREILEVLRERIANSREEELDAGCRELVAIAKDRWTRT
jgi:2-oxo-4-hydroxy-4-carboxy--5-ureidoimidazoline (OHCU) decarboxylase